MAWLEVRWRERAATSRSPGRVLFVALFAALLHAEPGIARTAHHQTAARASHSASAQARSHHARAPKIARVRTTKPHRATASHAPGPARPADRPLIIIDAGHGGQDPGAIGVLGTMEKTITLATAQELRRTLEMTGRYRIALTRTRDRSVALAERLAFAQRQDADLLIAIHADASRNHAARGASVYVSSSDFTTHFTADRSNSNRIAHALAAPQPEPGSAWLQYSMIEQLADDVRMAAAPARHAHLYVLGSRTIPSVLLEMGFLSNRLDEALLRKPAQRRTIVQAISDAIDDYFATIKQSSSRT